MPRVLDASLISCHLGEMKVRSLFSLSWTTVFLLSTSVFADYQQRFSFGAGLWHQNNPSLTDFELGAEYEYRLNAAVGLGTSGNYIFSSPPMGLVAAPEVFLHPFGTDWYASGAPLFEFGQAVGTKVGARLGTRLPIPLGPLVFIPSLTVDFIGGTTNFILGFGFQI